MERALNLMNEHEADLGSFLANDERGKRIPEFLRLVASHLSHDRQQVMEELVSLTKNVEHIKTIVAMQQSYAGAAGVIELVSLAELVEDALRLNASSFVKYNIIIVRNFADIPEIRIEKPKLLQILVNLLTNAKDSLVESGSQERKLIVCIRVDADEKNSQQSRVVVEVIDNGVGIAKENLTRVFSHGFTTKRHGHGFGLHSSANAAKELGGSLVAQSEGLGQGATFTLDLPFRPVEVLA
jgi:signal transduction histidine kinase